MVKELLLTLLANPMFKLSKRKEQVMKESKIEGWKEDKRIAYFLSQVSPIIVNYVARLLQLAGLQVTQENSGLNTAFSIKKKDKEAKMYLENLLLEIATVDRDQDPLRFDENLRDFDFFMAKLVNLTESKLKILFHFFTEENIDAAIDKISLDAKQYERIRIWQIDQKKPTRKQQH